MAKDPAFLFYSSDFIIGTAFFSNEQIGKYVKLLCFQHQMGHLSEREMLAVCKERDDAIFSKFQLDDEGKYFNKRLEEEADKRRSYCQSRREASSKADQSIVRIYLIRDKDTGYTKIGSSVNPDRRFVEMCGQKNPAITVGNRNYELIFSSRIVERVIEKEIHQYFASKRVSGEWFDLSEKDIKNVRETYGERTTKRTENENEIENEVIHTTNTTTEKTTTFLEFVVMTQGQYDQLANKLGKTVLEQYVERLNNYIGSKGKRYKSHYHTILNWYSRDGGTKPSVTQPEAKKKTKEDFANEEFELKRKQWEAELAR